MSTMDSKAAHRLRRIGRHVAPHGMVSMSHVRGSSEPAYRALDASDFVVSPEVRDALDSGRAVVALESTIISHGMPYPENLETAMMVESVVREGGAAPATIAILDGVVHIGLRPEDLKQLAKLGPKCRKVSRRDLAVVVAERGNGATTVAGTMYIANLAGIRVFVTGGIGGVHRGVQDTMDISADLTEIGRTPVAVVCAGVKSILDIPKTLEFLETQGVTVVTLGAEEFPAFFTRKSGQKSPLTLDSAQKCAQLIEANRRMHLQSGMVFAVPVPEDQSASAAVVERATEQALEESKQKGILGKDITPFLLQRIAELTKGESLRSNIALVMNNARAGTQMAVELSRISKGAHVSLSQTSRQPSGSSQAIVVGASNVDVMLQPLPNAPLVMHSSNPGTLHKTFGGVGRNIAEVLARLGGHPALVSALGRDSDGQGLLEHARSIGIDTSHVLESTQFPTSTYVALLEQSGDLLCAVMAGEITTSITPQLLTPDLLRREMYPLCVMDANIPASSISSMAERCHRSGQQVWLEPVGVIKALRCTPAIRRGHVDIISPSVDELIAMSEDLVDNKAAGWVAQPHKHKEGDLDFVLQHATRVVKAGVKHVLATRGAYGVLLVSASAADPEGYIALNFPPAPVNRIINTSGAGDSLVGGIVSAMTRQGLDIASAVPYGILCAKLTLESEKAVAEELSMGRLQELHQTFRGQLQPTRIRMTIA